MSSNQPQFANLGDWLIWRATGPLGDFRMPVCSRIIQTEGFRDQITERDIEKILARYKEHVSFWRINTQTIEAELNEFTLALDTYHSYFEIASLFDSLPAKRYSPG